MHFEILFSRWSKCIDFLTMTKNKIQYKTKLCLYFSRCMVVNCALALLCFHKLSSSSRRLRSIILSLFTLSVYKDIVRSTKHVYFLPFFVFFYFYCFDAAISIYHLRLKIQPSIDLFFFNLFEPCWFLSTFSWFLQSFFASFGDFLLPCRSGSLNERPYHVNLPCSAIWLHGV